jgi:hypothetical protein
MPARNEIRILCVSLVILAATESSALSDDAPRRIAVLIGVNRYDNRNFEDLSYAERDMEELAKVLQGSYDVRLLLGSGAHDRPRATKANLEKTMEALFASRLTKNDVALIAFSGHGQQMPVRDADGRQHNEPYFCPADAVPTDPATLFNVSQLISRLGECGAGTNLLLVDACRNDPDSTRGRGIEGDVAISLPKGMGVFFSCSQGEKALESAKAGGGHGLFFYYVLQGFRQESTRNARGEVTWDRLIAYVKDKVQEDGPRLTGLETTRQTPHTIANLGRSPVLIDGRSPLEVPKQARLICELGPCECSIRDVWISPDKKRVVALNRGLPASEVSAGRNPVVPSISIWDVDARRQIRVITLDSELA